MKLHWGHALFAAMAAFILIMVQFMVRAVHNQESLVAEDYYEQELRYQEQMDRLRNAAALGEPVRFEAAEGRLTLTFPQAVRAASVSGELRLLRPNDPRLDAVLPVRADSTGRAHLDTRAMARGAYLARLDWNAGEERYTTEERVHLP